MLAGAHVLTHSLTPHPLMNIDCALLKIKCGKDSFSVCQVLMVEEATACSMFLSQEQLSGVDTDFTTTSTVKTLKMLGNGTF